MTHKINKHVFMQTPFVNKFGICVFYSRVPTFDVTNPSNLRLRTCFKILRLPLEYLQMANIVALVVGTMSGSDPKNPMLIHLRFYMFINVKKMMDHKSQLTTLILDLFSKTLIVFDQFV